MKQLRLVLIIVLVAVLVSACNDGALKPGNIVDTESENDGRSVISNDNNPEGENNGGSAIGGNNNDAGTNSNNLEVNLPDDINVNDLLFMKLEQVIAILGPNYSEPFFNRGAPSIYYKDSFCICYYKDYESLVDGPKILPEADVVAIEIYKELDVYKGISAGKTLDEINSNPDLKYHFAPKYDGSVDALSDSGIYKYGESYVYLWVMFNKDSVCNWVLLKRENENIPNVPEL